MYVWQRMTIKWLNHYKQQWNLDLTNLFITPEVLDITNDILQPGQSYGKIYGTEPRNNEPISLDQELRFRPDAGRNVRLFDM